MKRIHLRLKYDIKLIFRDPIMVVFAILPLFLMFLFRFGLPALFQFIASKTNFTPGLYDNYIFAGSLIMTPYMTGTLAGFMMLDEKDGNVLDLILVTPRGFGGYLGSRLMVPAILSVFYTLFAFLLFHTYGYAFSLMPGIVVMMILLSSITALILFSAAKNKAQGLTYAKGLGLLMLPVFFDLINNSLLKKLGYLSPYYWIYDYLVFRSMKSLLLGVLINVLWFLLMILIGYRRTYRVKAFGS